MLIQWGPGGLFIDSLELYAVLAVLGVLAAAKLFDAVMRCWRG